MDKNSVIGLLLIGAIFIGFSYFNQPSEEEIATALKQRKELATADSLAQAKERAKAAEYTANTIDAPIEKDPSQVAKLDSAKNSELSFLYGRFANSATGKKEYITIENEKIKATISTLGGNLATVELKEYHTHDTLPLYLFDEDSSQFALSFSESNQYRVRDDIYTDELFFEPQSRSVELTGDDKGSVSMKLYGADKNQYIEYIYSLEGSSYMLDFQVNFVGMDDLLKDNFNDIRINWNINALSKEKSLVTENATTSVFYKYLSDDEVDYLSETSDDQEDLEQTIHWVAFKQQYFSAALICEEGFEKDDAYVSIDPLTSSKYTKYMSTNLMLPLASGVSSSEKMTFYFGPNHYQTLERYEIELEEVINLGWPVIRQVSQYFIIPIFNWLDEYNLGYGLIILILTLLIKMILFPLTFKNYKSTAKMKVLKPEIDAINEKHKNDDAMKKQQATMALYRKVGVNPMAGCLPMLLQMPILYAMFRFFPSSIVLRQQGFLWADDLSSYDPIYDFPGGFEIPMYGDHISLFTILMAISTFLYTKTNSSMTSMSGPQAGQMKMMLYFMPFMLLVFFNNYSAGLSYYYLLANVITMAQQFVIKKWFIDDAKILSQLEANKLKPAKKKSGFQKRLEDMAKQKGYKPPKK
ncbi:MAG: membrane protein insertase YidC [Flavobacteriales bacterium]|nr:membrane protein insertase YidC [Flavobacteriales bacterium]